MEDLWGASPPTIRRYCQAQTPLYPLEEFQSRLICRMKKSLQEAEEPGLDNPNWAKHCEVVGSDQTTAEG